MHHVGRNAWALTLTLTQLHVVVHCGGGGTGHHLVCLRLGFGLALGLRLDSRLGLGLGLGLGWLGLRLRLGLALTQTLTLTQALLSATMHTDLTKLASLAMHAPLTIGFNDDRITNADGSSEHSIPATLQQLSVEVPCALRSVALVAALRQQLVKSPRTPSSKDGRSSAPSDDAPSTQVRPHTIPPLHEP